MSKPTASAAGGAMPASGHAADHPDAALFALVEECIAAAAERDKGLDLIEHAENLHREVAIPPAVLRSERDLELRLYVGAAEGEPYGLAEIAAMRTFRRSRNSEDTPESLRAFIRCGEILDAWADWQDALAREEERCGLDAARRTETVVADRFDEIAEKVVKTPAATIEGVIAKARASQHVMPDDHQMTVTMLDEMRRYGIDEDIFSKSLARDLLRLAKIEGAAQ
jgi:hypothetical protein